MEVVTVTAKGGDVAGKMRRLEGSLGQLCDSFEEVKRLAKDSQEAADKCQVRFGHVFFQKHVSRHAFLLSKRQVRFRHVFSLGQTSSTNRAYSFSRERFEHVFISAVNRYQGTAIISLHSVKYSSSDMFLFVEHIREFQLSITRLAKLTIDHSIDRNRS